MLEILCVVLFAAVAVQVIYILVFIIGLVRYRAAGKKTDSREGVSVVVCAHDEESNLRELIPLLLDQNYPSFEVIIVNDRSNDGTYDLLLEETRREPRLKMVQVESVPAHANGKKYGLTLGIKAASFDLILLTDADCRPDGTGWIQAMSDNFDDATQIVTGFSDYFRKGGLLNLFIRFDTWLTAIQYFGFAQAGNPYMGVGRNLAYRKSFFLEKKGFHQFLGITGGDDDLFVNQHATARNLRVEMRPESVVHSIPKTSWGAFFRQKVRHLNAGKHYRAKHRMLLGMFGLTWILSWLAAIPLFTAEEYALWGVGALGVRWLLLIISFQVFARRFKLSFAWWAVPVLDFIYAFYYISTGVVALTTKKVQWTK